MIEAQVLVDFIAEFTLLEDENKKNKLTLWTVHMGGSSIQKMGGVGVVFTSPERDILKYRVQLQFPTTNNEAEYEVILMGLRVAKYLRARNVLLKSDSKLIKGKSMVNTKPKKARCKGT